LKTAVQALNAVIKNKDIPALMQPGVDILFEDSHGDVVDFVKKHYSKYRSVPDISIVVEEFDFFDDVEISGEAAYYIDKLREEYKTAILESISKKLEANVGLIESDRVISGALKDLMSLQNTTSASQDIDLLDFDDAEQHFAEQRRIAEEMGGVPGIPTGIDFIDSSYTSGLAGGDFVIVLGWTGRAKSLITTYIACNAFRKGFKPMIISLEMKTQKVRNRAYTMLGEGLFQNSDLEVGLIDEDNFRSFKKNTTGKGFPVISHDGHGEVTPAMVQSKIDQHKPDIIILDYAQLMSDNANSGDMTARMRNMSREYKMLAVANNIPIILISSATPDSSTATNTPPIIEQVAWSKQLSYDADLAFAVHKRDEILEGGYAIIEIVCRKNRNGDQFSGYLKAKINEGLYQSFFRLEDILSL